MVLALIASSSAAAETGVGEAPRGDHDIRDELRSRPISAVGPNSFRLSSQPALGGRGFIIELAAQGRVGVVTVKWADGHPRSGWRQTRQRTFRISRDEFDGLMESVDAMLADSETPLIQSGDPNDPQDDVIILCTDGPGYLSERSRAGEVTWLSGFCGENHPNDLISGMLVQWLFVRMGD